MNPGARWVTCIRSGALGKRAHIAPLCARFRGLWTPDSSIAPDSKHTAHPHLFFFSRNRRSEDILISIGFSQESIVPENAHKRRYFSLCSFENVHKPPFFAIETVQSVKGSANGPAASRRMARHREKPCRVTAHGTASRKTPSHHSVWRDPQEGRSRHGA